MFSTQWSLVQNSTRSIKKINGEQTYYILHNLYYSQRTVASIRRTRWKLSLKWLYI